jgi:hypothetical protein
MLLRDFKLEADFYISVLEIMMNVDVEFNKEHYWEIHDYLRHHKKTCENFHSLIWGLSYQTVTDDDPFSDHAIFCIRNLYRKSLVGHELFLARCKKF